MRGLAPLEDYLIQLVCHERELSMAEYFGQCVVCGGNILLVAFGATGMSHALLTWNNVFVWEGRNRKPCMYGEVCW